MKQYAALFLAVALVLACNITMPTGVPVLTGTPTAAAPDQTLTQTNPPTNTTTVQLVLTPTLLLTSTLSATPAFTATLSLTNSLTSTVAYSPTSSLTNTATFTLSNTPTSTATATFTKTPTYTATATPTPTFTSTPTNSPTRTITVTPSLTKSRTTTLSPAPVLVFTPGAGACTIVATGSVTAYFRPGGDIFGYMNAGDTELAMNYTLDGFVGFDPAVAHAGDIGIFRDRWVWIHAPLYLKGNCGALPIVIAPFPGVCYTMAVWDTPIYRTPSTSATVEKTMHVGDYVKAIGQMSGWIKVDSSVGNLYLYKIGWITEDAYFPNGPCSALPTVTP